MATCETYAPGEGFSEGNLALIANAFKDEKFRGLFCEYAKELCDPEKQKQYEHELKQYEKERGVDVVFVEPRPFLALAAGGGGDGDRVFINICSSDAIQKPSFEVVNDGNQKGQRWAFPHAIPKTRQEHLGNDLPGIRGTKGAVATVHDVVFHPDTLLLASRNDLMRQTIIQTAMDSLKNNSQQNLGDPQEVQGTKYVGKPIKSVIRKVVDRTLYDESEKCDILGQKKGERTSSDKKNIGGIAKENGDNIMNGKQSSPVTPVYKLKHVSKMDLQDFSVPLIGDGKSISASRPQALELEVELPAVARAVQVDAHVLNQVLHLSTDSKPQYKLELPLPYPVDDDSGTAKFDVATQKLTLTFPVIPLDKKSQISMHSPPCDSGIECEIGYRTNSDGDNSSEVSVSSQEDASQEVELCDSGLGMNSPPREPMLTPSYAVKQSAKKLLVTLNCGNVLSSSIETQKVNEHTVRIELASVGGGQTLLHYGLSVDCSPYSVQESAVTTKIKANSIQVTIMKERPGRWESCQVGNGDHLTRVELEPVLALSSKKDTGKNSLAPCLKGSGVPPRSPRMARTLSMCEGTLPRLTGGKGPTCSWPRGILKHRTRSLSESQADAVTPTVSLGSSLDLDLPEDLVFEGELVTEEEEEGSMASSLGEKKSVRFNEVVKRQLFRSNRSITFERARIQREKRKAKQRSRSESDRTSESEKESGSDSSGRRRKKNKKGGKGADSSATDDDDLGSTTPTATEDDTTTDTCDVDDLENNNCASNKSKKKSKKSEKNVEGGEKPKSKRKNKNKDKKFEPSNNFIFQLDIEP